MGAYASDAPSYSFVQVSYLSGSLDDGPDFDGLEFDGSVEVGSHVHFFAGYSDFAFDTFLGIDADGASWNAGVGFRGDVVEEASVFGEVGYVQVDLESNVGDDSDDGFGATIGIRSQVSRKFELLVAVSYVELSDAGDDTGFIAGALFNLSHLISFGIEYTTSSEENSLTAGVRIYFGNK
jgi:hypothetical protein